MKLNIPVTKTFIWLRVSFDMLYLCNGGWAMIFSFDKSTSPGGGGQKKSPEMTGGGGTSKK